MSTAHDLAVADALLTEPKIERLLTLGREINDLLFKVNAATSYLAQNSAAPDYDAVEVARTQLARDLSKDYTEAEGLLLHLDEAVAKLEEQRTGLENVHKMNVGLAKIEGLSGSDKHGKFVKAAAATRVRISELGNLISALDALGRDLGKTRRSPHLCPRCASHKVSYRITPSETGFTLYKCDDCGNAWRITEFSIHVG